MKTRIGFVSNSSSSSFVVAFPEVPTSAEELCKIMFADELVHHGYEQGYPTIDIAQVVFHDIQEQKKTASKKIITEAIACGWYDGTPEMPPGKGYSDDKSREEAWEEFDKQWEAGAKTIAEKFIAEHDGEAIYTFDYADNDGEYGAMMEHSGIFDRLSHLQISCH